MRFGGLLTLSFTCLIVFWTVTMPPALLPSVNQLPHDPSRAKAAVDTTGRKGQQLLLEQDSESGGETQTAAAKGPGDAVDATQTASPAPAIPIDLDIYIVFHKQLSNGMYEAIDWSRIFPQVVKDSGGRSGGATMSLVERMWDDKSSNKSSIIFLGTNPQVHKTYDKQLVRGRLMWEWEMPGYNSEFGPSFNEFGAMSSIYNSNLTSDGLTLAKYGHKKAKGGGGVGGMAGRGRVVSDLDDDGVQEWIGVFQHDMRLDDALLRAIRRRIVTKTQLEKVMLEEAWKARTQHGANNLQRLIEEKRRKKGVMVDAEDPHLLRRVHCCVFYAVTYPTKYFLDNPLGMRLVKEYNEFYRTNWTLKDMPRQAIIDVFVVPNALFNKIMPFLDSLMRRMKIVGEAFPPTPEELARGKPTSKPLSVMERALAVALGLETRFIHVQIPLRHERPDA